MIARSGPSVLMLSDDGDLLDRRVLQQAATLAGDGFQVTLLHGIGGSVEEERLINGVVVRRHAIAPGNALRGWRRRVSSVTERIGNRSSYGSWGWTDRDASILSMLSRYRPEFVHVHNSPWLPHGAWLAEQSGAKLVYDAHEIYDARAHLPALTRWRLRHRERRHLQTVRLFTTVNDSIADVFEGRYRVRPGVLLNAAPYEAAPDVAAARQFLRREAELTDDTAVVVYQGWFSAERNLETILHAARNFPAGVVLAMIGYGAVESALRSLAERVAPGRVIFLGRREGEALRALTAGADAGLIPYLPIDENHRLCSPNKFFEYIQARIPVLAHPLPFFERMASRYDQVQLVPMDDTEAIAAVVGRVLERRSQLLSGAETAARDLAWEAEAPKLLEGFRQLREASEP